MGLKKKYVGDDQIVIFDEALIQKRGEFWYFRMWLAGEGTYVRVSLRTQNRQTAIDKAKTFFHQIKADQANGKTYFSLTAEAGVELYLEQRQKDVEVGHIVKGRYGTIRTHLGHWLDFIGRKTKLKELERTDCENYFYARAQESAGSTLSQSTVKNEQTTINAMMEWLWRRNEVTIREFDFKKLQRVDSSDDAVRRATFTREEVTSLRKVLVGYAADAAKDLKKPGNLKKLVTAYYLLISSITGLRTGEQRQLTWGDIRFDVATKNKIEVGIVAITVRSETSKVRKRRQFLVQDDGYFDGLFKIMASVLRRKNYADCLIFSTNGTSMIKEQDILDTFAVAVEKADIDNVSKRKIVPYSFRHYFITDRIKSGLSYARVAQICGTSVTQIEKIYYHIDKDVMITDALASYFVSDDGVIVTT
jgi:integrase